MSNFTPAWFKKGFFNESLFCDDFLSTHQLLYSNGAFFTPDGRMVDPMPLRCEIFEMMREYVGANLAKKATNVVDVLKLAAQVEDFPPVTDRIALANGTCIWTAPFRRASWRSSATGSRSGMIRKLHSPPIGCGFCPTCSTRRTFPLCRSSSATA